MYDLIVSPFLGDYLVLRSGSSQGLKISRLKYLELQQAALAGDLAPTWLTDAARHRWDLDLTGQPVNAAVLVRAPSVYGFVRASYELNLGCNYACEHCYLGLKKFEGLTWPDRKRLLHIMRDAGVLWLQLTGGEPLIDPLFPEVYRLAHELGMMLTISSNGSRLHSPTILDLFTTHRPYRVVLSVYGATENSYDGLTRRRGSFNAFHRGLAAAMEADLPIRLNLIVTDRTAHEVEAMTAMAERLGLPHHVYSNMSPTIYGGPESLPSQSTQHLRKRKPFTGCNAVHPLSFRSARYGFNLQGRSRSPDPTNGGRSRWASPTGRHRRLLDAAHWRMLRLRAVRLVRDLPTAGQALPAGEGTTERLLSTREGVNHMATVAIELQFPPKERDEVEFIEDVEVLSESNRCSCAASDDNPY